MKFTEWKNSIKKNKRVKRYQHIDQQINLGNQTSFRKVVKTLENLSDHQFLPFIKRESIHYRYIKKDSEKPQKDRKIRPIMYASHLDSAIYNYYNYIYSKYYEDLLDSRGISENVSAYRSILDIQTGKGKSNINFAHDLYEYIQEKESCAVIAQDIKGFFDKINHKILKDKLCKVLGTSILNSDNYKVFRSLTRYKYITHKEFVLLKKKIRKKNDYIFNILEGYVKKNQNGYGIPQGSPISGLFSNIYMFDFDIEMKNKQGIDFYRRYSDDLIFICDPKKVSEILDFIDKEIMKYGLEVQPKKCSVAYIDKINNELVCTKVTDKNGNLTNKKYFDYLGFEFYGNKTLVRRKTIGRLGWKQRKKVEHQSKNSEFSKNDSKRKEKNLRKKDRRKSPNYLSRIMSVFNDKSIKKQVLRMTKKRNIEKHDINNN